MYQTEQDQEIKETQKEPEQTQNINSNEQVNGIITKLLNSKDKLLFIKENIQKYESKRDNLLKIRTEHEKDMVRFNQLLVVVKEYYNKFKKDKTDRMQNTLTVLVNDFFDDNHVFKFTSDVKRGKNTVSLISVDKYDKSRGSIQTITSDSEQQLIGYLIPKISLYNLGSELMILDEAFNSFGPKEVSKLPLLLTEVGDMQQILVEHKKELFESLDESDIYLVKYTMDKNNNYVYISKCNKDKSEIINQWLDTKPMQTMVNNGIPREMIIDFIENKW